MACRLWHGWIWWWDKWLLFSQDLCVSGLGAAPCAWLEGRMQHRKPHLPQLLSSFPEPPELCLWPCFRVRLFPSCPWGSPEGPELGYLTAPNGESRAPVSPSSQSCMAFPQSLCWCESGFSGSGSGGKTKSLSLPQLSRKLEEAFKWETHGCL